MRLAKRTLFVDKDRLEEVLGLPEGVEILAVRPNSNHNGWEFLLASAGEVSIGDKKVTIYQDSNGSHYTRISLDTLSNTEEK